MEKYGVITDETPDSTKDQEVAKEKSATTYLKDERVCPRCGEALTSSEEVNVPYCVNCGTAPFETD